MRIYCRIYCITLNTYSFSTKITGCVSNLKFVQSKLDPSLHKPLPIVPQLKPDEIPERLEISSVDYLYLTSSYIFRTLGSNVYCTVVVLLKARLKFDSH